MADKGEGNYALVTGASMGLGKVFAEALAARKHNVILVARGAERLSSVAKQLSGDHGIKAEIIAADLSKPHAATQLADEIQRRGISVDLLVNNAGFGLQGEFRKLALDDQLNMIALHNSAVVELSYLLLPSMIENRKGGIINVSSMAGMQAAPYATLYSATKSFLTTFSIALEREVWRHGIKVVTLCPGKIRKERVEADPKKVPGGEQSPQEVVADALKLLDAGGGLLIPGFVNKFANFAQRFFPRRLVAKGIGKISKPKQTST